MKIEALAWPAVETVLDLFNVFVLEHIEVDLLWQVTSDETVGVLDGALLPTVVGSAEERTHTQSGVKVAMEGVLQSVIIGDGAA